MKEKYYAKFVEELINKFESKKKLVSELANLLSIEENSVYRRLRGDTVMTLDELFIVAKAVNISLDEIIFDNEYIRFQHPTLNGNHESSSAYLTNIEKEFFQLLHLPGGELFYASRELPFFQFLPFPELAYFKLYVWGKDAWRFKEYEQKKFSIGNLKEHIGDLCGKINSHYSQIDSIEIWSGSILDSTINQIFHHLRLGNFQDNNEALVLFDLLEESIDLIERSADSGFKKPGKTGGRFKLYYNNLIHMNNTIMVKGPNVGIVFVTFDNPNYIKTTNVGIANYIDEWFINLRKSSRNISVDMEADRKNFFKKIRQQIRTEKKKIEAIITYNIF